MAIATDESVLVESVVASYCHRKGRAFYFKGQGEVDVIQLLHDKIIAIEVKWANQIRPVDLKTLKQFANPVLLTKTSNTGHYDGIDMLPVYQFLR